MQSHRKPGLATGSEDAPGTNMPRGTEVRASTGVRFVEAKVPDHCAGARETFQLIRVFSFPQDRNECISSSISAEALGQDLAPQNIFWRLRVRVAPENASIVSHR